MLNLNPIESLYDEYIKIIKGITIKYSYIADSYENLVTRRYVDAYMDAYYELDTFESYEYTEDDLKAIDITDQITINYYLSDLNNIPNMVKNTLLEYKRYETLTTYIEENPYYRMLHGLPALNDREFIYVDYTTCVTYSIDPTIPVHKIEDELGVSYINTLESIGYIDQLILENPDKEYLKYLGSKRIDIVTARKAKNFEILYLDESVSETIRELFVTIYEQCREYFMTTLYIFDYRKVIDYYDRFMGLCMMVMALQQLTTRSIVSGINRNFFDSNAIQALYEQYDIPFYSKLDHTTQKAICQNINMLIQNKGTNKVIYDIASLLGFNKIEIYRYYLMKEHIMDSEGNPLFIYKEQFNEDTGKYEQVYDLEAMYDVYFQKVKLGDYDYHEALEDKANHVAYETVTSGDPYWVEDDALYKEVWESEYNYKESKYLGITVSYKLSEMLYENILLFRLIFNRKYELEPITLKLPSVSADVIVTLFDAIVLLCGLTSKKYGLKGEVISKPSQVIHVIDAVERVENPYEGMNETFAFNFSYFTNGNWDETKQDLYKYMSDKEVKELEGYIKILTIPDVANQQKIIALNQMYQNIKNLSKFLSEKMAKAKDIDEYKTFVRFFRALYYSRETSDIFTISDEEGNLKVAETFNEYLNYSNPALGEFLENVDSGECHIYIDHVINRIETILDDLRYLYLINNSTSSVQEVLIDMIRFFKSYTTDMIGLNIVYIFDFKPDNLLKLIDRMEKIDKKMQPIDKLMFGYNDAISMIYEKININEMNLVLRDIVKIHSSCLLFEKLSFAEELLLAKYIGYDEILKFIDDILIHCDLNNSDNLKLTDEFLYDKIQVFLDDSLKFKEEVDIDKVEALKEFSGLFDVVGVNKTISESEYNFKMCDKCFVINK